MDEEGIQQIVPFANQAMIKARSKELKAVLKTNWSDPKNCEGHSELMIGYWSNLYSVYNSKDYREKLSELKIARWDDPNSAYNKKEYREKISQANRAN